MPRSLVALFLLVAVPAAARGDGTSYDAATAKFEQGDTDGALAEIARVEKQNPKDAVAVYYRGVFLEKKGDAAGAEKAYRAAVKLDGKLAEAWSNLCALRLGAKAAKEAAAHCEKAVAANPSFVAAWFNLGLAYQTLGDAAKTERAFEKVTGLAPDRADGWMALGAARLRGGDKKQAVVAFRMAAKKAPRDAQARFNLGAALAAAGDLDGAARELAEATKLDPKYATAFFRLGSVERRRGQKDAAVAALEQAKKLAADDPAVALELGLARAARGGKDDDRLALAELARAEKLAPRAWEPPFYQGLVHAGAGRCAEAKKAFARYGERDAKRARQAQVDEALGACGQPAAR